MRRAALAPALLLTALTAAGCGDSSGPRRLQPPPTLLLVDPTDFLGAVACLDQPGAMQRYVATLTDVTENLLGDAGLPSGFSLPSSGPVPCGRAVTFGFVVPGHEYTAEVAGYDRSDLSPLGGSSSGSPVMVDADGDVVTPRWTTTCGRVPDEPGTEPTTGRFEPAVSHLQRTIPVRGCAPLADANPTSATGSISVSLSGALGSLECGEAPGQVESFRARLGDTELSASCGDSVVFEDLAAGDGHSITVQAFEDGRPSPRWSTTCFQVALAGVQRPAACEPLDDRGSLRFDVPAILAQVGATCTDGSPRARITVTGANQGSSLVLGPQACSAPFVLRDLAPGVYDAILTTTSADGSAGPSASCETTVSPGAEALAECVASPAG